MKRVSSAKIKQNDLAKECRKKRKEYANEKAKNEFKFNPNIPPRSTKPKKINRINPMDVPELNLETTYISTLGDDMKERELTAQKQAQKLKGQVAPLYSKGAYQLITSVDLLHDIGKKK